MKLINGQFYSVTKQRYTGITAKKTRGRWQYRDAETNKLYASGITPAQFVKEFWFAELIEEESQNNGNTHNHRPPHSHQ